MNKALAAANKVMAKAMADAEIWEQRRLTVIDYKVVESNSTSGGFISVDTKEGISINFDPRLAQAFKKSLDKGGSVLVTGKVVIRTTGSGDKKKEFEQIWLKSGISAETPQGSEAETKNMEAHASSAGRSRKDVV